MTPNITSLSAADFAAWLRAQPTETEVGTAREVLARVQRFAVEVAS